jgi:hypothetical protein
MVGNGVTNWTYDTYPAYMNMAYWHSLASQDLRDEIKKAGCDYSDILFKNLTPQCGTLFSEFQEMTNNINVYNILGKCWPAQSGTSFFTHHDYTPWMKHKEQK